MIVNGNDIIRAIKRRKVIEIYKMSLIKGEIYYKMNEKLKAAAKTYIFSNEKSRRLISESKVALEAWKKELQKLRVAAGGLANDMGS